MFDLFRSRDKIVRFLLGGLLVIVALSMLIYLIPGYGGSTGGDGADPVVAEVGKDTITQREVQTQVQNLVKNRQLPAQLLSIYVPQVIDQMVTERAMAFEAAKMGFSVSDAELADTIRSLGGGRFTDPLVYKQFVEDQGFSVPEFERSLRDSMLTSRLEAIAAKSVVITPAEIAAEFSHRNDKVKLAYILLAEDTLSPQIKPTDAQLQAYFAQHRASYRVPEKRSAAVLVVDRAKVSDSIAVSDDQLHAAYNSNIDSFRTPERVQVRHILLTTTGKSKEEVAEIRKKAEDLLRQLKAGADFAELAKKNSQDPGSAVNGGDLGWIVKGQTVKSFEAAAFSLKPKELSGIITTEYGFHIIQVMDHQAAHVRSFDEVKTELTDNLKKQQVNDRMQALGDQAQAELSKAPQTAQQIAQKLGLTVITAQSLGATDPVPGLVSPQLSSTIASLPVNGVGAPVPIGNEKLAVAVCTGVQPSRAAELGDVMNQVRAQYNAAEVMRLEREYGARAAADLKSGKDIQAIAKELHVEVKTPAPFASVDAVEGFGPASALGDIFSKPVGTVVGPSMVSNKTLVGKIVQTVPADQSLLAAQREAIAGQIRSRKTQEATTMFEDSIRQKLTQEGKIKINKDVIGRIAGSYNQS